MSKTYKIWSVKNKAFYPRYLNHLAQEDFVTNSLEVAENKLYELRAIDNTTVLEIKAYAEPQKHKLRSKTTGKYYPETMNGHPSTGLTFNSRERAVEVLGFIRQNIEEGSIGQYTILRTLADVDDLEIVFLRESK